jgi:hypothetical protein
LARTNYIAPLSDPMTTRGIAAFFLHGITLKKSELNSQICLERYLTARMGRLEKSRGTTQMWFGQKEMFIYHNIRILAFALVNNKIKISNL